MDKQGFLDQITAIGQLEDVAQMRASLAELTEEVSAVFDSNESLTQQNQQYVQDNESLRSANMRLFLQVGEQRQPEPPAPEPPKPTKLSFNDLFDERGNIK